MAHKHRLDWLDQARGLAVLAMTAYHFSWDLFSLGLSRLDPVNTTVLAFFAKSIAACFLLLSGFALVIAHPAAIHWGKVRWRFLWLAGAAAVVSFGSFVLFPASWIAFGILHHMALAGLLGLVVLRWPLWANDYVPLLPWFGFFLIGMIGAKLSPAFLTAPRQTASSRPQKFLGFLGRHSLIYYLIHQPVLLGLLNGLLALGLVSPAQNQRLDFTQACERDCSFDQGDEQMCRRICGCLFDNLQSTPDMLTTTPAQMSPKQEERLRQAIKQCR
jgi:uncharacterized membrane protein